MAKKKRNQSDDDQPKKKRSKKTPSPRSEVEGLDDGFKQFVREFFARFEGDPQKAIADFLSTDDFQAFIDWARESGDESIKELGPNELVRRIADEMEPWLSESQATISVPGANVGEEEDWDRFATAHFPSDFHEGEKAMQAILQVKDRKSRIRLLEMAVKDYPSFGPLWLALGSSYTSLKKIRDTLLKSLERSEWMVRLAKETPEFADQLIHNYVMHGLDVAGEFWLLGMRPEALDVHRRLLKVTNDDVGGQQIIFGFRLLEEGKYDELTKLMEGLIDNVMSLASYQLLNCFMAFAIDGDRNAAKKWLMKSHELNATVFDVLLGGIQVDGLEDLEEDSSEMEAHWLGNLAMASALSIDGLTRWLRETLDYVPPAIEPEVSSWEDRLPGIWEVEFGTATWFVDTRKIDDAYITIIGQIGDSEMIAFDRSESMPTVDGLWELVLDAIEFPEHSDKIRPEKLIVTAPRLAEVWADRCAEIGVSLDYDDELALADEIFEAVVSGMSIVGESIELNAETIAEALDLPRTEETWIVAIVSPPIWLTDSANPRRAVLAIVVDAESGMVRMQDLYEEGTSEDSLTKTLLKAVFRSMIPDAQACLPERVEVLSLGQDHCLEKLCRELSVTVEECEDPSVMEFAVEQIMEIATDPNLRPSIQESAELTVEETRELFHEITSFYRLAPWRTVALNQVLRISPHSDILPEFFCRVCGQLGDIRGVQVAYSCEDFQDESLDDSADSGARSTLLSFEEDHDISPLDLWLIEKKDLEFGGDNGYPYLQHYEPAWGYRRPNRKEVCEIQVALRCVQQLMQSIDYNQKEKLVIDTFDETVVVGLEWIRVDELE